jgi:chorismate mutase
VEDAVAASPYDRDAERVASSELLAQAQWLYEQHERRVQNSQNMAIAILTITGTILAVVPSLIPGAPSWWVFVTLGALLICGGLTIVHCVRVLVPRTRVNGLPNVKALRSLARDHEKSTASEIVIPVSQFVTDLLNPMNLDEPSPLGQAAEDAARRARLLRHAYGWFAATFGLAVLASALFALFD